MADEGALAAVRQLRGVCLAFPGTDEKDAWGEPSFRARGRVFAICKGAGRAVWCRAPEGRQRELMAAKPGRYFIPPYLAHEGWVGVVLDDADWEQVGQMLRSSYDLVIAAPDAGGGERPAAPVRATNGAYPWALAARRKCGPVAVAAGDAPADGRRRLNMAGSAAGESAVGTVRPQPGTAAAAVFDGAHDLLDEIAEQAEAIDRDRAVPDELFGRLVEAGCTSMLLPPAYAGAGASLPEAVEIVAMVARADASTGWLVSQLASAPLILGQLPASVMEEVYGPGPSVVVAGAVAPKGRVLGQNGEWRVSGQWPFASGCRHAEWVYLQCLAAGKGAGPAQHEPAQHEPAQDGPAEDGPAGAAAPADAAALPPNRLVLLPVSSVEIVDTWWTAGLRGTGSHDVRVTRTTCPDRLTGSLQYGTPVSEDPVFALPLLDNGGLLLAAVMVGTAEGALDDLAGHVGAGARSAFSRTGLAASAVLRDRLGEAYVDVQAARALLHAHAASAWADALVGRRAPLLERAARRGVAAHVTATAARVVDAARVLAGAHAAYDASPLQRRSRDVHTATQHVMTRRDPYEVVGALAVGEDPPRGMF